MMQFTESGLRFRFDSPWRVIKYDDHRLFRRLSGRGYKGVDFLALSPARELVLMEVKNLAQYPVAQDWSTLLEELTDTVGQKVEDTLQGIDAIHRGYQRKWWYPRLQPLTRWEGLAARWEWFFWKEVAEMAAQPGKISVILWLNSPSAPPGWQSDLDRQLHEDLRSITSNILITNRQADAQKKGWAVDPAPEAPEKPDA